MKPYAKYRHSGVEWLGDVPEHWPPIRLRYRARITPSRSELNLVPGTLEVSFVPMESVHEYGGLTLDQTRPLAEVATGYTYFRDGDVLTAKITPCFENGKGSIAKDLVNGIGFGTTELHVLRPCPDLDRRFLFYVTISHAFRNLGAAEMYGAGGQKRVPEDFIRDFRQPIPSVDEQRAIAAFLDRETARIDALIEKKRRQIELLQEKRSALISHAVTKGLDPKAKMKDSGIEWLGQIPAHWEVWKAAHMLRLYGGHAPESVDIAAEGTCYFKVDDLNQHDGEQGLLLRSSALTVMPSRHEDALLPPMILIPKRGAAIATNKVRIATDACLFDSNIMGIQIKCKCRVEYVAYTLLARGLWDIADVSTIPQINNKHISPLKLPVPPLDEQRAIVDYIESEVEKIDTLAERIMWSSDKLCEFRTALISAAVTGKIDVRGN